MYLKLDLLYTFLQYLLYCRQNRFLSYTFNFQQEGKTTKQTCTGLRSKHIHPITRSLWLKLSPASFIFLITPLPPVVAIYEQVKRDVKQNLQCFFWVQIHSKVQPKLGDFGHWHSWTIISISLTDKLSVRWVTGKYNDT